MNVLAAIVSLFVLAPPSAPAGQATAEPAAGWMEKVTDEQHGR